MANVDEYQIRELAKDEHCWRIDWFGAVTYAERYRRASQPLIEVQLSQVPDDLCDVNDLFVLKNDQWPKTKQIKLPVGLLPLFKIGDIWRDGRLIKSPDYDLAHFDNLSVGRNKTSLIKSGLSEKDGGAFYLPITRSPIIPTGWPLLLLASVSASTKLMIMWLFKGEKHRPVAKQRRACGTCVSAD